MTMITEPMHPDFVKILGNFKRQYGEKKGTDKFYAWLNSHELDDAHPYSVQAQIMNECLSGVCEAFRWAEPLIALIREDTEAKYYKSQALTANVSMNKNDYTNAEDIYRSAPTLTWRPLNFNHDHNRWLPFPENRVDWAAHEDNAVEAILRIANDQPKVQRMIETGEIMHVSIEGAPRGGVQTENGRAPKWYNFTALALLEKNKTLPGDPLTTLEPLFVREDLAASLVESLGVQEIKVVTNETDRVQEEAPEEQPLTEAVVISVDSCGNCGWFQEQRVKTMNIPHLTGETDSVKITRVEAPFGLGWCPVGGQMVRESDAACKDASDRTSPTTKGVLEMLQERADLTEKNLKLHKDLEAARGDVDNLSTKLTEATDTIDKLNKTGDKTGVREDRLLKDLNEVREERDALKDNVRDLDLDLKTRDQDVTELREDKKVLDTKLIELKEGLVRVKAEIARSSSRLGEESEKRAAANQRAEHEVEERIKLQEELSDTLEKVSSLTREVSDAATLRNNQARQQLKDSQLIEQLRKETNSKTDTIRELKQKLSKSPSRIRIKV